MVARVLDSSGMRIWVTPLARPAEILAEAEGMVE